MKNSRIFTTACTTALVVLVGVLLSPIQAHEHVGDFSGEVRSGAVSFPISCKASVQGEFNHAIALLHSFGHSEAQRIFESIESKDPRCAMASWGVALSHFHLGLSWPSDADLDLGRKALVNASARPQQTAREAAYIDALVQLYASFKRDDAWRYFQIYANQLGKIAAAYPDDFEARAFEGLALILAQAPNDPTLGQMRQAINILNPLLAQKPNHPGVAHYLIHACDTPGLAREGLEAARRYAKLAPAAPHALHMPSHIFTRLGFWQEDISSNLASKAAAERTDAGAENRLHAMEFLEYAYLQSGSEDKARAIWEEAKKISQSEVESRYRSYYSTVQTRFAFLFAIETRDWATASTLESQSDEGAGRSLALLAHAMAAGHLSDLGLADSTLAETKGWLTKEMNGKPLPEAGSPGAEFLDQIQAWYDFTHGNLESAEALLLPIADRQEQVGKGELDLPVREMLADMLRIAGSHPRALAQYQRSLKTDPNRFNSLLGAVEAAALAGRRDTARQFYEVLRRNCPSASGTTIQVLEQAKRKMLR